MARTLIAVLAFIAGPALAAPFAMITDLKGQAWAMDGAQPKKLALLGYIENPTEVKVDPDGKVAITYLDGKEINRRDYDGGVGPTAETPTDPPQGNYDINWGAWEKRDDWTTGCVDDSAIFSRALSAAEVKALYDEMLK